MMDLKTIEHFMSGVASWETAPKEAQVEFAAGCDESYNGVKTRNVWHVWFQRWIKDRAKLELVKD